MYCDFEFNKKTVSGNYYSKSNLNINNKSEEALADFINNAPILLLHGFIESGNELFLYTKVSYEFMFINYFP